jgi:hypothetical protein
VGFLCTSFTLIPSVQPVDSPVPAATVSQSIHTDSCFAVDAVTVLYNNIHLHQYGLSREAFDYAWKGYRHLLEKKMISRSNYLTICDFSQSSKQ